MQYESEMESQAIQIQLGQVGLKSTSKRLEILQFLKVQRQPVPVEEIHKAVSKNQALDLATVYRNLKQLVEVGIVRKSFFDEGRIQYSMSENQNHSHDHHIQCIRCEEIEPVKVCLPVTHTKVFENLGYQQVSHRLEFFGICHQCQKNQKSNSRRSK